MRVVVAGAGAVGSYLGGALAAGGAEVVLAEPGPRARQLEGAGLTVFQGARTLCERPAIARSVGEALAALPGALVLVAVKSHHTAHVAAEVAAVPGARRVTSVQNGIGNDDVLAAALPDATLHAATLTTGLRLDADGAVHAASKGGVGLGAPPGGPPVDDLAAALAAGGVTVRTYSDPAAMKWSKLLLNLLGSATSAALGWPPARVFADQNLFEIERRAWLEALAVMRAQHLAPVALPGYPVPLYARAISVLPSSIVFRLFGPRLAGGRGDRLPGVAADLAAGRTQTENGVLTGAVVRYGDAVGVPVPISRALADLVDALATGAEPRSDYAGRPAALLAWLRSHDA